MTVAFYEIIPTTKQVCDCLGRRYVVEGLELYNRQKVIRERAKLTDSPSHYMKRGAETDTSSGLTPLRQNSAGVGRSNCVFLCQQKKIDRTREILRSDSMESVKLCLFLYRLGLECSTVN